MEMQTTDLIDSKPNQTAEEIKPEPTKTAFPLKMLISLVMLIIAVGGGGYYLGTQNASTDSAQMQESITASPTSSPQMGFPAPVDTETVQADAEMVVEESAVIPSTWKAHSGMDPYYSYTTTLSLPPGWSFGFSGSEWTIKENLDASELWDYRSSIWLDGEKPRNFYSGQSRRAWYQDYLAGKYTQELPLGFEAASISKAVEHKAGAISYLEVTVTGGNHGRLSGADPETHYVFVKDGILHVIRPASEKAASDKAELPQYLGPVFASLSSKMVTLTYNQ